MDHAKIGRSIRVVRIRRRIRQADLAALVGLSQPTISRIEGGRLDGITLGVLERVLAELGIGMRTNLWWQGAELDRLIAGRHSAMHDAVARLFEDLPAWVAAPEVTFAVFGERGVIDILAWHAETRSLLVIELKTELVDVQETVGTLASEAATRGQDRRGAGLAARDRLGLARDRRWPHEPAPRARAPGDAPRGIPGRRPDGHRLARVAPRRDRRRCPSCLPFLERMPGGRSRRSAGSTVGGRAWSGDR